MRVTTEKRFYKYLGSYALIISSGLTVMKACLSTFEIKHIELYFAENINVRVKSLTLNELLKSAKNRQRTAKIWTLSLVLMSMVKEKKILLPKNVL